MKRYAMGSASLLFVFTPTGERDFMRCVQRGTSMEAAIRKTRCRAYGGKAIIVRGALPYRNAVGRIIPAEVLTPYRVEVEHG